MTATAPAEIWSNYRTVAGIPAEMPLPGVGHNMPPMTPLESIGTRINDLYDTVASATAITNEDQARDVAETIAELRKAEAEAEDARTTEKAPHLAAGRAVDEAWKPLTIKSGKAKTAGLAAQTVWLNAQDAERVRREFAAAKAAETLAEIARQKHAVANPADLDAQEEAEAALQDADKAARAVKAVATERTVAKGYGGARGIGLRSVWAADITDAAEFARWMWRNRNADYLEWLAGWADREVKAQKVGLPGVVAVETKVAM